MYIFAVVTEINPSTNINFGNITSFCQELSHLSTLTHNLFYVTSLQLFLQSAPKGYILKDTSWELEDVPYPSAMHNRIHIRKTEHSTQFKQLLNILDYLHIPIFNDHFMNKWDVHHTLGKKKFLFPYIPNTELLQNKKQLTNFLEQHKQIFIKPIYGSQGRNIFRIHSKEDHFVLSDSDGTDFTYPEIHSLFLGIKNKVTHSPHIIQQGITLLTFQNQPFDFRILTHKSKTNSWILTSIIARISATDKFVSNIARGGNIKSVNEVLINTFSEDEIFHIKKLITELSLEISKILDYSTIGIYGEFGIDLALDINGNPWLIEVNTKPSKNFYYSDESIRPSSKAIFRYFLLLSQEE